MIDLPPKIARGFMADLAAYCAEVDEHKRTEIAARQRHILSDYLPQRAARLRVSDVRAMFDQMRGQKEIAR
jgi:hypothetical protein